MTTSEQPRVTVIGKVVDVYRRCHGCNQWKPLGHFLLLNRLHNVRAAVHICAACRRG